MKTTTQLKKSSGNTFTRIVTKPNFMTPDLIGYYRIKNGEVEVTKGSFLGNTIYGVTVVQGNRKDDDLSKCLHSIDEVMEYVESLN